MKTVTNDELALAIKNRDNLGMLSNILYRNYYFNSIDKDDISSCYNIAVWKALQTYDKDIGNCKFTTYLYQAIYLELRNMYRLRLKTFNHKSFTTKHAKELTYRERFEEIELEDAVSSLPEKLSRVVRQKYLHNMTLEEIGEANGYSRESARRKSKKAIKKLMSLWN